MFFYGKGNRQFLDLRNDLVVTFDKQLVTARDKRSAPYRVRNATYILMNKTSRLRASWRVLKFIWSKQLLTVKVKTMKGDEGAASSIIKREESND